MSNDLITYLIAFVVIMYLIASATIMYLIAFVMIMYLVASDTQTNSPNQITSASDLFFLL